MKMYTSYFGFIKDIPDIDAAGYDHIELHIKEIMSFSNKEFEDALQTLKNSHLTCQVCDNPLPLDVVVADNDFDMEFYFRYFEKVVERTAKIGAKYFVYGNGKTRSIPEGDGAEKSRKKNDRVLKKLCEIAAKENITVLIEPLAPTVSNRILSLPEAAAYIEKMQMPNLKTLLDFRWFVDMKHPYNHIVKYQDIIKHVHIDNPLTPFPKRYVPKVDDGFDYGPLFETLKKICYQGIISYEANTTDDFKADLRKGLEILEKYDIIPYNLE